MRKLAALTVLLPLAACSVGMAMSGEPSPNLGAVRQGVMRGEVEMHLLAVRADARGAGLGRSLVLAAIGRAQEQRYERLLLWTQATMFAAHALYAATGFERRPERDFTRDGKSFLFLDRSL